MSFSSRKIDRNLLKSICSSPRTFYRFNKKKRVVQYIWFLHLTPSAMFKGLNIFTQNSHQLNIPNCYLQITDNYWRHDISQWLQFIGTFEEEMFSHFWNLLEFAFQSTRPTCLQESQFQTENLSHNNVTYILISFERCEQLSRIECNHHERKAQSKQRV